MPAFGNVYRSAQWEHWLAEAVGNLQLAGANPLTTKVEIRNKYLNAGPLKCTVEL